MGEAYHKTPQTGPLLWEGDTFVACPLVPVPLYRLNSMVPPSFFFFPLTFDSACTPRRESFCHRLAKALVMLPGSCLSGFDFPIWWLPRISSCFWDRALHPSSPLATATTTHCTVGFGTGAFLQTWAGTLVHCWGSIPSTLCFFFPVCGFFWDGHAQHWHLLWQTCLLYFALICFWTATLLQNISSMAQAFFFTLQFFYWLPYYISPAFWKPALCMSKRLAGLALLPDPFPPFLPTIDSTTDRAWGRPTPCISLLGGELLSVQTERECSLLCWKSPSPSTSVAVIITK